MNRLMCNVPGVGVVPTCLQLDFVLDISDDDFKKLEDIFDRLFAYEDTGKDPEDVATMQTVMEQDHDELKQLKERTEKAEAERDAAVEDLKYVCAVSAEESESRSICDICQHKQTDGTCVRQCELNTLVASNKWQWRGVQ